MRLLDAPPAAWDERIAFPLQSVGFADAARALGHQPVFVEDGRGIALALVRRVPLPAVSRWTARAKVYAHARDATFVPALVERLARRGVSHVRLGDWMWGGSGPPPADCRGLRRVGYHALVLDLAAGERGVLSGAAGALRRHVRTAAARVAVSEVRTAADLRDYVSLAVQTGLRMRIRDQAAAYTAGYFEAIVRRMVPRGQAEVFIARAGDVPLAGGLFLTTADRFVHVHGCSTRDRGLTPLQGPTAVFWHAIRVASARRCAVLDMGAVTPTDDPRHPHHSVYRYKRAWGGRLVEVPGAEVVLSRWKYRLQELVLAPMWDRVHPLYLRLFGAPDPLAAAAAAGFDGDSPPSAVRLSGQERPR